MPFLSWFEQREQLREDLGKIQGLHQGIALGLELKFGAEGQALAAEVEKQTDLEWLQRFMDAIRPAKSLADLRAAALTFPSEKSQRRMRLPAARHAFVVLHQRVQQQERQLHGVGKTRTPVSKPPRAQVS